MQKNVAGGFKKANRFVNKKWLLKRQSTIRKRGYTVPKYLLFCRIMINIGFGVHLYEAKHTRSKYITIYGSDNKKFKVRFSNHVPNRTKEETMDCDFFVGLTNFKVNTTQDAILSVLKYFNTSYDMTDRRIHGLVQQL